MITSARLVLPVAGALVFTAAAHAGTSEGGTETVEQALCRLIEGSAKKQGLPVSFLTRLIWRESSFRVGVVSTAGAQGVAQLMPGTARERGLTDPFDPEQAIPHAAHLLADLRRQFGNLGLAAAAYNGGPSRVTNWLAGAGNLPAETRAYVHAITGVPAEEWRAPPTSIEMGPPAGKAPEKDANDNRQDEQQAESSVEATTVGRDGTARRGGGAEEGRNKPRVDLTQSCLQVTAALRIPSRGDRFHPSEKPIAPPWGPWGIQLAGNFSKALALQSFARARVALAQVIGGARPMIIGTRLGSRGTRAFYRIRIPAQSREAADTLCSKIHNAGGPCIVLKT